MLLLFVGCSSDDESEVKEPVSYDPTYEVKYYDQPVGLDEKQGYMLNGKFVELIPQRKQPYILIVRWNDKQGKEAIDDVLKKNEWTMTLVEVEPSSLADDKGECRIISERYFESPYFYVSVAYQSADTPYKDRYDIHISPAITLKVADEEYVEAIEREYADVLTFSRKSLLPDIYDFECRVNTSREVLRLCLEIGQLEGIVWAEPSMYGTWALSGNNSSGHHADLTCRYTRQNLVPADSLKQTSSKDGIAVTTYGDAITRIEMQAETTLSLEQVFAATLPMTSDNRLVFGQSSKNAQVNYANYYQLYKGEFVWNCGLTCDFNQADKLANAAGRFVAIHDLDIEPRFGAEDAKLIIRRALSIQGDIEVRLYVIPFFAEGKVDVHLAYLYEEYVGCWAVYRTIVDAHSGEILCCDNTLLP